VRELEENEEIKGDEETLDFSKPSFTFKPIGHHAYKQNGPYLICKSCEIQHATWVGIDKVLVGFNEKNEPIIQDVIVNG
jgi:hypothetical protein